MTETAFERQVDELRRTAEERFGRQPAVQARIDELAKMVQDSDAVRRASAELRQILRSMTAPPAVREQLAAIAAGISESEAVLAIKRQVRDCLISELRNHGASLRDIAPIAGVTPEMVRRLSDSRTAAIRELANRLNVPVQEALRAALRADVGPQDWTVPLSQEIEDRLRAALKSAAGA